MTNEAELSALAAFAGELADVSARVILPHFRQQLAIDNKEDGGFDPVTIADRDAEAAMRELIMTRFPDHGIIGEEHGHHQSDADDVWVLDPIDGTRAFIVGFPVWGTLIGLIRRGKPIVGVMGQPFIGERFTGYGRTALYQGPHGNRQLHARACASLASAMATTTSPRLFSDGPDSAPYLAVEQAVRHMRYGGDCYGYAMVAAGQMDLVIETGLNIYDIAALIPIIEGAGGRVSDWEGREHPRGGRILATSDNRVHEQVLQLLHR